MRAVKQQSWVKLTLRWGYKLGGGWVQPDVSVTFAFQTDGQYLQGAPAIAIEVVSPSNTAEVLDIKTDLYFEFDAREVWRVYPKTRHVAVHLAGSDKVVLQHESVTTPLIPGLVLTVAEILGQ